MGYAKHVTKPKFTHQKIQARPDQVQNNAGGYVFKADDWVRLDRFLILGNEAGTYYASEKDMTIENYDIVRNLIQANGAKVVDRICEISKSRRAAKNLPAIFALAVCSVFGDQATRTYANRRMREVCRFSTDMFRWVDIVNTLKQGKHGKGLHRALGWWYVSNPVRDLTYQVCKYPHRKTDEMEQAWSHRDILRLIKIGPNRKTRRGTPDVALLRPSVKYDHVFNYAVNGRTGFDDEKFAALNDDEELRYIYGHEMAKQTKDANTMVRLIKDYRLTLESVPNNLLTPAVWKALLVDMPMNALVRNMNRMTAACIFEPMSNELHLACDKLTNEEQIQRAGLHPMNILKAHRQYAQGHGDKGDLQWTPVQKIMDALDDAFDKAFACVEPSGKAILTAIDMSGSMQGSCCNGCQLIDAATATAVMAMVVARREKNSHIIGFHDALESRLSLSAKDTLETATQKMDRLRQFRGTDCSLPIMYALQKNIKVDAFVIMTDGETWAGHQHPFQALQEYRRRMNPQTRCVVVAFSATGFSIMPPEDSLTLNIAGLDTATPQLISDFAAGRI